MAVIFQVNGAGGANELEVSDDGTVKVKDKDVAALLGDASAFVADPTGGATNDAEARTAIAAILDILIAKGLMASS
jgi:hypothetical protein